MTQVVSASVLFVAAATIGSGNAGASLANVGQISEALTPHLGVALGRLVFSRGVLGASIVAAIVCSLALAWALGEAAGHRRTPETQLFHARFSTVSTQRAYWGERRLSGGSRTSSG